MSSSVPTWPDWPLRARRTGRLLPLADSAFALCWMKDMACSGSISRRVRICAVVASEPHENGITELIAAGRYHSMGGAIRPFDEPDIAAEPAFGLSGGRARRRAPRWSSFGGPRAAPITEASRAGMKAPSPTRQTARDQRDGKGRP